MSRPQDSRSSSAIRASAHSAADQTTISKPVSSKVPEDGDSGSARLPLDEQPTVISADSGPAAREPSEDSAARGTELEGTSLGHFRLDRLIGGGGMGLVYRGQDQMLDRTVAVKVLTDHRSSETETVRRFSNEAQSAARLDHDNIARVYYIGEDKGYNFIVFEFIDGINLRDLVRRDGLLSVEDAVSYSIQMADALAHAADREVVHRDIKPSNVLVTPDGRAKLVDMGLARFSQMDADADELTATGVTLGTFDYISPEQARDPRLADPRSDLYSLGCTLYFMLVGQPPFPDGTVLQKLLSHSGDEPPDPRQWRSDLPDDLVEIVQRLLAKSPDERFGDPSELVGELLLLSRKLDIAIGPKGGTVWVTPNTQRPSFWQQHLPWLIPLILFLVVVLTMEFVWPWYQGIPDRLSFADSQHEGTVSTSQDPPAGLDNARSGDSTVPGTQTVKPKDGKILSESSTNATAHESAARRDLPIETVARTTDEQQRAERGVSRHVRQGSEPENSVDTDSDAPQPRVDTDPAESASVAATDVLIVGDYDPDSQFDPEIFCDSLSSAWTRASEQEHIREIRLRFNGVRHGPQDMAMNMTGRKLRIRADDGYRPTLAFSPGASQSSGTIRLVGGELTIQGFDLILDCPLRMATNCSLFALDRVQRLSLEDTVITVREPMTEEILLEIGSSIPLSNRVSVIHIFHDLVAADTFGEVVTPWVQLTNAIVRGHGTLLSMAGAAPLRLDWNNGLLSTSQRLLDCGGIGPDATGQRTMDINLYRLTADTGNGLINVNAEDGMFVDLMTIDLECRNCLFYIPIDSPWIQYIGPGMSALDRMFSRLSFHGEGNLYQNIEVFWRLRQASSMAALVDDYERESLDAERWQQWWETDGVVKTQEFQPIYDRVRWKPWSSPYYARSHADYSLEGEQMDPTLLTPSGPGFDHGTLPNIDRTASTRASRQTDESDTDSSEFSQPSVGP